MFCKKGVLSNFAKFTGKHLCQSLFFNKVAALRPATLLKKRLWHRCFPVNFAKFLRTAFIKEHLWWRFLIKGLFVLQNWLLWYVQKDKVSYFGKYKIGVVLNQNLQEILEIVLPWTEISINFGSVPSAFKKTA